MNRYARLLMAAFVVGWTACQPGRSMKEMPVELRGEWHTSDARYRDRGFELRARRIIFDTGNGTFTAHPVVSMDSIVESGLIHFRLLYDVGSSTFFHFDFSYDPEEESIRFRNQPQIVWFRTDLPDTIPVPP